MRILQANKFFFHNGGSETVMFQERDFLLKNGHEVIDFSMQDERNYLSNYSDFFVQNRSYHGFSSKLDKLKQTISFVNSREAADNIGRLMDSTRPDILHCHNIYHQLTPSIIGEAKKRSIPVVLTLHDYKLVCPTYNRLRPSGVCSDCIQGDFSNVLVHRCANGSVSKSALLYVEAVVQNRLGHYEQVDSYIAPSRFMQEAIQHRFYGNEIELIYNGVDTNEIQACDIDEGYVLYLGRLVPEKGIETLLKAYSESRAAWKLVVAGTGPLLDVLKQQYNPDIFIGHQSGLALKTLVGNAAMIVVPSEWYENCPMSVLEAMAYGKPVVAARIGGIPELVIHGETGLLYESGNATELARIIQGLMKAPERRRQMGISGRARVEEKFSLNVHHESLMHLYEKLIGRSQ